MLKKLGRILQNEIDPAFGKRSRFIFEEIEKQRPKVILDIGCGRGFYLKSLGFYKFPKKIVGIDINDKYLLKAKKICQDKRIIIKKGSIYSLPYRDNYFDFIICSEVLEHLKDDKKGFKELFRVLKRGGTAAITVPNYHFPFFWDPINFILMRFFGKHVNKNVWWLAGIWADHERLYRAETLLKRIDGKKFVIKKFKKLVHYCWPFSHFLLYGVGKNLVERVGLKKYNRFNFANSSPTFLAKIFSWPSSFDSKRNLDDSAVNLCILLQKKQGAKKFS